MIRTLSAVATAALMLAGCGASETADPAPVPGTPSQTAPAVTAPDPNALTAGGYGPLRIGMTRDEVVTALGDDSNPDAVGGPEPEFCDQWRPARAPDGLLVMIQEGVLTRISIAEPSTLRTDRGFGVGDTAEAIKAAYGPLAVSQPHKYVAAPAEDIFVWTSGAPAADGYTEDAAARGIRYEIDGDGEVRIIHVGGPAIQLVEGCL